MIDEELGRGHCVLPRDITVMRVALRLARRAWGRTSPNPLVGAVLTRCGQIIGRGWHHAVGHPHAEIEAIADARDRGHDPAGATLVVTLEPCCTHGRTPPCTEAIIAAGIRRVLVGATDPNPAHLGRAFAILRRAGVEVAHGILEKEASQLNAAFNHWIIHRTPFITVKAAMTLDGKIATAAGESKWITGAAARRESMKLRQSADAILVGVNTILADDPSLTARQPSGRLCKPLRRIVLDSSARTPRYAQVVVDGEAERTTVVVTRAAPAARVVALRRRAQVWVAPAQHGQVDLRWLLRRLGQESVTHLLVEGGGEVNASFLLRGLAHRVVFFYAPMILGGRLARRAVAGPGAEDLADVVPLTNLRWHSLGPDLMLVADVVAKSGDPT